MRDPQDPPPGSQGHLSPAEIVRYIDRTLHRAARREAERHLAECEACLREVIESQRVLRDER
jgi:anti-sigma factor RsiW